MHVRLVAALRGRYPWLDSLDYGPRAVVAGECDVCGDEARLVQPCGPPPEGVGDPDWAVGRRCAAARGVDGWCAGHADEAAGALAWLESLPAEADDVARLWWLAMGEVRPDPALRRRLAGRLGLPAGDHEHSS